MWGFPLFIIFLLGFAPALHAQEPTSDNAFVEVVEEDTVVLNFSEVDIREFIQYVSDETGRRFILDRSVNGNVSLVAPEELPASELFPFFVSVIESMGFTTVERPGGTHIVKMPTASPVADAPLYRDGDILPEAGLVTRVFELEHQDVEPIRKVLEKMIPGGSEGTVNAFPANNNLIVTATADTIRRVDSLIGDLDQPRDTASIEVVPLVHADPAELAQKLSQAMQASRSAGQAFADQIRRNTGGGIAPPGISIIAAEDSRSLILVGAPPKVAEVKAIIALLDTETAAGRGRLGPIFLDYYDATLMAKNLNALMEKSAAGAGKPSRIAIEADPINNAILIDADAKDRRYIQDLVRDLDREPQQILVEILIAEIAVDRDAQLGVEWATIDAPRSSTTTGIGRSRPGAVDDILSLATQASFPQGLSLGVARGTFTAANGTVIPRIPVLLTALAQDRDVKILSNIPLWAQNNTEATVSIVENIPVLRSTIEGGSGTARDVIQNIDRQDVGIKLSVTPRVTPDNKVTLQIAPSIEAIITESTAGQPFTPTIAKREVDTTVTVPDRSSVIISGLMREDKVKETRRVPVLGYLPYVGDLFKNTTNRRERTNLLIFVTPHVVTSDDRKQELKARWQEKTGLRSEIEFERIELDPNPIENTMGLPSPLGQP